jgi:hypothetical protein
MPELGFLSYVKARASPYMIFILFLPNLTTQIHVQQESQNFHTV